MLKIDDLVKVIDGSYTILIDREDGVVKDSPGVYLQTRIFRVLYINGSFPAHVVDMRSTLEDIGQPEPKNNLMLVDLKNGDILFTMSDQVIKIEQVFCPHCETSFYREIKGE